MSISIGDTIQRKCHTSSDKEKRAIGKVIAFTSQSIDIIAISNIELDCCSGILDTSHQRNWKFPQEYLGKMYFIASRYSAIKINTCAHCLAL